ncbi:MAG TPA: hypothetical protein VMB03_17070 [Bryobacteraceae bacterium]|nr:hypothetical protein [Bryobacteraceae bacterium]
MAVFLTVLAAAPVFGAEGRTLVHISSTQNVPFQAGGTIRVNHSFGELWIQGWDRPDVEITVTKSPDELYGEKDKAKAGALADRVKVTADRASNGDLVISTDVSRYPKWLHPFSFTGDVMMQYRIRVPREAKLVVHHKDGEVLVSDMMSDIEATGRAGDIVVLLPQTGKYAIDARSRVGTLSSDFEGTFHHGAWSSDFHRADPAPAHRVYLREGIGGIEIMGSPAEAITPAGVGTPLYAGVSKVLARARAF